MGQTGLISTASTFWQRRRLYHFLASRSERLRKQILVKSSLGGAAVAALSLIVGLGAAPAMAVKAGVTSHGLR